MTALADTPLATDTTDAPTTTRGSKPLAIATLAAPVALAAGVAVHPDDTKGVEKTLTAIAGDESATWLFTHVVEPYAWALMGITLMLVLPRMAGKRGGGLLRTAAVMCGVGFVSLAFLVYAHGETFRFMAATDVEPSVYGPLFEAFEKSMPIAALPSMLGQLGLLLGGLGLLRARTVPVWTACTLSGSVVLFAAVRGLPMWLGLSLYFGALLASLAVLARRTAREGGPALGARTC